MSSLYKKIADNNSSESLSHEYRYKRFQFFMSLVNALPKPIRILDIGGTQTYWENMNFNGDGIEITLLNLSIQPCTRPNFKSVIGDATNLSEYADNSFDLVYSNSCIEHLFTWENQQKMAKEVIRVGKKFFIQTPNRYFPIEPHYLFPFFQFLPFSLQVFLLKNFTLGHVKKKPILKDAEEQVREIQLLSAEDMEKLFPNSTLYKEKFYGLTKSLISYKI